MVCSSILESALTPVKNLRSLLVVVFCSLLLSSFGTTAAAQAASEMIHYSSSDKLFRIDAAGVTYAFGVNERGELQPVYWGQRLGANDALPTPHTYRDIASFDLTTSATPQEFSGWGAAYYSEPSLKVNFPDGNRDLVLHYQSHTING